jgi:3-vinyl bacteriochlorophyllide hydratase
MLVLALHTAYLVMLSGNFGSERERLLLALAAYVTYAINAGQFILKLRAARLQSAKLQSSVNTPSGTAMAASA